jgi:hypothetical protein
MSRVTVAAAPQIADIVVEANDDAGDGARAAEALVAAALHLVAGDQARERQGHIERVLAVVVGGLHAVIAADIAGKQPLEIGEALLQGGEAQMRPHRTEQRAHLRQHCRRGADLYTVGDVVIASPHCHGYLQPAAILEPRQSRGGVSIAAETPRTVFTVSGVTNRRSTWCNRP